MRKSSLIVLLLILCLVLSVFSSGIAFATSGNWVEKGRLTGFAPKFGESPLYTIESNDWRIKWEYVPYAEYPNLTAFSIHVQTHAEVEGGPILPPSFIEHEDLTYSLLVGSIIKSGTKETNGILYINGFNGTFVMDIVSNADSYVLIIEQNIDSIPEFPSWTTIYIRADGSVEGTDTIRRDGTVYTFTSDVFDSIVVEKDDVVIDGAGYTLQGNGNESGIFLNHRNNVTIKNIQIKDFYSGIRVRESSNNTISGNIITNNTGLYESGIYLQKSSYNTITGNIITDNVVGIFLRGSLHNILRNNNFDDNTYNLQVEEGPVNGVIGGFVNDIDVSNMVNGKPVYYWVNERDKTVPSDAGYVGLINCSGITVQNLSLANNHEGILLDSTTNSTITINTITNNLIGINLFSSSKNRIVGNSITNNFDGISLIESSNTTVSGNLLANNNNGIDLDYSDYNSIIGNTMMSNENGIYFSSSYNNSVFDNSFINNTKQVYDSVWEQPWYPSLLSVNFWDNGTTGNYWSNYNGTDNNGDGIGDTPYVIDQNNQDNYPLMEGFIIPEFPSWTPMLIMLVVVMAVAVIYKRKLQNQGRRN